jgi:hypothetical protein
MKTDTAQNSAMMSVRLIRMRRLCQKRRGKESPPGRAAGRRGDFLAHTARPRNTDSTL